MVSRMAEIYENCAGVVAWLGPSDDTSHHALLKIMEVSQSWEQRSEKLRQESVLEEDFAEYFAIVKRDFPLDDPTRGWDSIAELSSGYHWERAWVFQEMCVAPGLFLVCGALGVDWIDICNMESALSKHSVSTYQIPKLLTPGINLSETVLKLMQKVRFDRNMAVARITYQMQREKGKKMPLLPNLKSMRGRLSKDDRDKVYAAFSISDIKGSIGVDYSLPTQQMYTNLARHLLDAMSGFQILSFCRYPPLLEKLPTWVPDWTDRTAMHRHGLPQQGDHELFEQVERYYSASGGSLPCIRSEDEDRILVTDAVFVDTIAFVSSMAKGAEIFEAASDNGEDKDLPPSEKDQTKHVESDIPPYMAILENGFEECARLQFQNGGVFPWGKMPEQFARLAEPQSTFDNITYLPTQEPMREAFWKTVCADVVWSTETTQQVRMNQIPACSPKFVLEHLFQDEAHSDVISLRMSGRRIVVSQRGLFALVPLETRIGDSIFIVTGSELPFVLRPSDGGFCFIGQCYVHGIMDGEVWDRVGTDFNTSAIRIL